ncbi:MAG: restriction endonuclease subunit S [Azoarcus sp.]|jgi:type I restriction enzyme S subunit|nr:restriction endonuclease subunit S [Azoarcus sp.]
MPKREIERLQLGAQHLDILRTLLGQHVPQAEVWAYGSRVNGDAHECSDLDLVLLNPQNLAADTEGWMDLKDALQESCLPMLVDVHDWAHLPEDFHRNIEWNYVVVQEAEWQEVTLGDVAKIKHGFAFKGEFFTDEVTPNVLVTPGNFAIGGGFQIGKPKYYAGPLPKDYVLPEGEVVVTMTDLSKTSDTLGYAAKVPVTPGVTYWHNQRIGLLQVTDDLRVCKDWLHYLMRMHEYRAWIVGSASGTTVKHTSPSRIESFSFKLPPLPEQRAIARILGTLDERIELNRRMNATLEAMARALFKSWFVDFDGVAAKDMQESELGLIPKGWGLASLDSIANYLNGLALQKFPPENETGFLPVIKIAQLRAGNTEGADRASRQIKSEYIVEDGDVLFSWSGSLEVEVWTGGRGALNQHLFKVTSSEVPKWFYYFATRLHLPDFRAIAAGKATTMGHIQRRHLTAAKVVVPLPDAMVKFDAIIAPLFGQIINNALRARTLAQLRDTLLPKLISGELRIKDAERFVEAT